MTFFSTSEKLEIGGVPFISHTSKPNRFEALEYYRRVCESHELSVNLFEKVDKIEAGRINRVFTEKGVYQSRAIILATGFYDIPYLMNVPGEALPKVRHYYDEPHPYFRQDIVVVGAANSAVDVALETWRKGARVTMVARESGIPENVKYWVKPDIENRIREGSIQAYFNATLSEIREKEVDILTMNGIVTLKNDFVLAMTGYRPDFKFMEEAGIELNDDEYRTPVYNEDTNETNMPGVYLAGVACGGLRTNKWFIENSRVHAETIVKHFIKTHQ